MTNDLSGLSNVLSIHYDTIQLWKEQVQLVRAYMLLSQILKETLIGPFGIEFHLMDPSVVSMPVNLNQYSFICCWANSHISASISKTKTFHIRAYPYNRNNTIFFMQWFFVMLIIQQQLYL